MRIITFIVVAIVLFVILASAVGQTHPSEAQHPSMMMQTCPMLLGADLAITDVPEGIALTFTTKTGEAVTSMHMMPFSVKYEAVEDGVRLILTPKDPAQLEEFRAKVRQHANRMK